MIISDSSSKVNEGIQNICLLTHELIFLTFNWSKATLLSEIYGMEYWEKNKE
jgi:hypothetical protein